jgi:tRNA pseudouridine(55) synthase
MELFNQILNKIYLDELNRPYAILALYKEAGITSHDLVREVRELLQINKVGHAGTLDPFATGLMIVLVGKNTKYVNEFSSYNKTYKATILLGIETDSEDPTGTIKECKDANFLKENKIREVIKEFKGEKEQTVPIFSSVKIDGIRLRELAHASSEISKEKKGGGVWGIFTLFPDSHVYKKLAQEGKIDKENRVHIELPSRNTTILSNNLISIKSIQGNTLRSSFPLNQNKTNNIITDNLNFKLVEVQFEVSKGTYIRQIAEDVGNILRIPASLLALERIKIGPVTKDHITALDSLCLPIQNSFKTYSR